MTTFREWLENKESEVKLEEAFSVNTKSGRRENIEDSLNKYPDILKIINDNGFLKIIDRFTLDEKRISFECDDLDLTVDEIKKMDSNKYKIRIAGGSKPNSIRIIIKLS